MLAELLDRNFEGGRVGVARAGAVEKRSSRTSRFAWEPRNGGPFWFLPPHTCALHLLLRVEFKQSKYGLKFFPCIDLWGQLI